MNSPITIECENTIPDNIKKMLNKLNDNNDLPIHSNLQPLNQTQQNLPIYTNLQPLQIKTNQISEKNEVYEEKILFALNDILKKLNTETEHKKTDAEHKKTEIEQNLKLNEKEILLPIKPYDYNLNYWLLLISSILLTVLIIIFLVVKWKEIDY